MRIASVKPSQRKKGRFLVELEDGGILRVTEEELLARGVNMVIYANQLLRASYPMMEKTARSILEHHRALESEDMCMSIKHILSLLETP